MGRQAFLQPLAGRWACGGLQMGLNAEGWGWLWGILGGDMLIFLRNEGMLLRNEGIFLRNAMIADGNAGIDQRNGECADGNAEYFEGNGECWERNAYIGQRNAEYSGEMRG